MTKNVEMNKMYDCGILNFWYTNNYGALLTCYALQKSIKKLGFMPKVINYISPRYYKNKDNCLSGDFSKKYLDLTNLCLNENDLECLNSQTNTFIVGSDQVWRHRYFWGQGKNIFQLNFTKAEAKKIAYAASFGTDEFEGGQLDTALTKYYIQRFDAISVREDDGVDICRRTFDVAAAHVLDPVFLPEIKDWNKLIDNSTCTNKNFIATYILDVSDTSKKIVQNVKMFFNNEDIINLRDAQTQKSQKSVEDWLYAIKNCRFFITDSFHGACFAIIFNKPFICLANINRGYSRFKSLFKIFGLENRCVLNADDVKNNPVLFDEIDFSAINSVLKTEKERSLNWLKAALNKQKKPADINSLYFDEIYKIIQIQRAETYKNIDQTYKNLILILKYPKLKRKYLCYKFLSQITFGKLRKKYKLKRKELKATLREIKKLKK